MGGRREGRRPPSPLSSRTRWGVTRPLPVWLVLTVCLGAISCLYVNIPFIALINDIEQL